MIPDRRKSRGRPRQRNLWLWLTAALLCTASLSSQIEIRSARWGFAGHVTTQCFNLLTVEVYNGGDKPFRGRARLAEVTGFQEVGAPHLEPCFLGPGSSRTIQMLPFVSTGAEEWLFQIGRATRRFSPFVSTNQRDSIIVQERRPATVVLSDVGSLTQPRASVPLFPGRDFPHTVAGTGGLGRLLLDHDPDIQTSQRRALLDWLLAGGELHLFHNGANYPLFQGDLDVLNDPTRRFVGLGEVIRHPYRLGSRSEASLLRNPQPGDTGNLSTMFGQGLRAVVTPEHNWTLIYLVLALFFIAVVPLHAWLSIRKLHYGVSIALLLGVVAATTAGIFAIGRRGYGEASAVHGFSYVKVLEPGRYDVTQIKNIFSTTSDQLSVQHLAMGSAYATAANNESVPGAVFSKGPPRLEVAIPLFTSRPIIHRGVVVDQPLGAEITAWPRDVENLSGLRIEWKGPPAHQVYAFRGRFAARGSVHGSSLRFGSTSDNLAQILDLSVLQQMQWNGSWNGRYGAMHRPGTVFSELAMKQLPVWIGSQLGVPTRGVTNTYTRAVTDEDHIRLIVICSQPDRLKMKDSVNESGYAVYDTVLPKGE